MKSYRLFSLNDRGRIQSRHDFMAIDDNAAVLQATSLLQSSSCGSGEIWCAEQSRFELKQTISVTQPPLLQRNVSEVSGR